MFSRWIARPFSSLLERLPSQCAVCRAWPSRPVCDACVARFAPPAAALRAPARCPCRPASRSAATACVHPPPLDACLAACAYAWPWPECIAQFKFRGEAGLGRAASPRCCAARPGSSRRSSRPTWCCRCRWRRQRLRERGFNQALRAGAPAGAGARPTPRCCCAPARRRPQSGLDARGAPAQPARRLRARAAARRSRARPARRAGRRRDDQRRLAVRRRAGAARGRRRAHHGASCWRAPTRRG